jgi:putative NIF3 family GTP cyclohydrolase 1 type 2
LVFDIKDNLSNQLHQHLGFALTNAQQRSIADINADCFITGEVSEQIPAIAKENDIAFISAMVCHNHQRLKALG